MCGKSLLQSHYCNPSSVLKMDSCYKRLQEEGLHFTQRLSGRSRPSRGSVRREPICSPEIEYVDEKTRGSLVEDYVLVFVRLVVVRPHSRV